MPNTAYNDSLIIFDACGRETWLPSSSTRRSAMPPRLSVTSMEFPPGKSPSPHIPGPPVRPFTTKLFPPPSLSQRRRNLFQPVTKVFNSYAERRVRRGKHWVLSTQFFELIYPDVTILDGFVEVFAGACNVPRWGTVQNSDCSVGTHHPGANDIDDI